MPTYHRCSESICGMNEQTTKNNNNHKKSKIKKKLDWKKNITTNKIVEGINTALFQIPFYFILFFYGHHLFYYCLT